MTLFKVSGESVTQIARDLLLEGNWRKALNLLVTGLDKLPYEYAIDILMCRTTLIGENNNVELCDDEPDDEYLTRFNDMYPPAYEFRGHYYAPSSYVASYCVDDLAGPGKFGNIHHAAARSNSLGQIVSDDKIWRSLYYAKNTRTALAIDLRLPDGYHEEAPTRDRVVLFEEVPIPPFWIPVYCDPQESLDNFLTGGGKLDIMGYSSEFTMSDNEIYEDYGQLSRTPSHVIDLSNASGIAPEDVESMLSTDDDSDVPPVIDKDLVGPCAYVLPDGKIYNCTYMKHRQLAERILKFVLKRDFEDPEKELDNIGAVRIARSAHDHKFRMMIMKPPTPSQRSTLRKWWDKFPSTSIEDFTEL